MPIPISLRLTLSKSDWDSRIGGWKCDALSLPGAQLDQVYFSGREASARDYSVENGLIVWNRPDRPPELLVTINLEKDLSRLEIEKSRLEDVKANLETQKFELEKQKFKSENKWKLLSAVGAVCSAILGFIATNFLSSPTAKVAAGPPSSVVVERVFSKSNDFLSSGDKTTFLQLLKNTQREAWFFGTSFYISVDAYRDELLERARSGVELYFLLLDPASPAVSRTAVATDLSEETIREQCVTGIRSLNSIVGTLQKSGFAGRVHVRLSSEALTSRIYFFDPRHSDGVTYFVPHVNFMSSQVLPGYLVRNKAASFNAIYFQGVSKLWNSKHVKALDTWLHDHPEFGIK